MIELSDNCALDPRKASLYNDTYDNTDIQTPAYAVHAEFGKNRNRQGLSPGSVVQLFAYCPNLTSLSLIISGRKNTQRFANGMQRFLLELLPLMSRLSNLTRLELIDNGEGKVMNKLFKRIPEYLPFLESFRCSDLWTSAPQGTGGPSLGRCISQLKNLTRLELHDADAMDESWCLHAWSHQIKEFEIHAGNNPPILFPSVACRIINHAAPNVTCLELLFGYGSGSDRPVDILFDAGWSPQTRFNLYHLTSLCLKPARFDILAAFQDCKLLRCLEYTYIRSEDYCLLQELVCASTWPNLTFLKLHSPGSKAENHLNPVIAPSRKLLHEFCNKRAIRYHEFSGLYGSAPDALYVSDHPMFNML